MKKFAYAAVALAGAAALIFAAPQGAYAGGSGGHGGGGHGGGHGMHGSFHGFHGKAGIRRGGRLNIGPLATRRHVIPRNIGPLAGRHGRRHHRHHGHHRGRGIDTILLGGDTLVTEPLILQADPGYYNEDFADSAPAEPHVAHPVIRTLAESQKVCTAEYVMVPSSEGGDKTVTIIRC